MAKQQNATKSLINDFYEKLKGKDSTATIIASHLTDGTVATAAMGNVVDTIATLGTCLLDVLEKASDIVPPQYLWESFQTTIEKSLAKSHSRLGDEEGGEEEDEDEEEMVGVVKVPRHSKRGRAIEEFLKSLLDEGQDED